MKGRQKRPFFVAPPGDLRSLALAIDPNWKGRQDVAPPADLP
jgi:hypothetical protein